MLDENGAYRHLPTAGGIDDQPADFMDFADIVQGYLIKKWKRKKGLKN